MHDYKAFVRDILLFPCKTKRKTGTTKKYIQSKQWKTRGCNPGLSVPLSCYILLFPTITVRCMLPCVIRRVYWSYVRIKWFVVICIAPVLAPNDILDNGANDLRSLMPRSHVPARPEWIASAVWSFDSSFANVCRELPLKSQGGHPLIRLVVTYGHLNYTSAPSYRWSVGASKLGTWHLSVCSHDIFWSISFIVPFIWMGNLRRGSHRESAMREKKKKRDMFSIW